MSNSYPKMPRIIILGGGYAGLTAAQRLGQKNLDADILMIDAKGFFEERNRLHQVAAGQVVARFSYPVFLEPLGVQFIQATVVALDPDQSSITVEHNDGTVTTMAYDYLVYALGSGMKVSEVFGVKEYAYTLQSEESARQVYCQLSQLPAQAKVLIVGGGLTGIETAAELAESMPQLQIALSTRQPLHASKVAGGFSEHAVEYLEQALKQRHIRQHYGRVVQLSEHQAILEDGSTIEFDLCVWTCGFKALSLATQVGIEVADNGQIRVDNSLRALSHPNIVVVGDAAYISTQQAGMCRMGSATALAMGPSAANTIIALLRKDNPPAFEFVYLFRNIGLGRHDGVIQFVDRQDRPSDFIWTGKKAAAWKEYVVRYTLTVIRLKGLVMFPAIPPLRTLPQLLQGSRQYL